MSALKTLKTLFLSLLHTCHRTEIHFLLLQDAMWLFGSSLPGLEFLDRHPLLIATYQRVGILAVDAPVRRYARVNSRAYRRSHRGKTE